MDEVDATATPPDATLEVTDHFFITGRGGLVLGRPLTGRAQVGMNARSPVTGESFRVMGCGSVHPMDRPYDVSCELVFRELSRSEVTALFPVGSIVLLFKQ